VGDYNERLPAARRRQTPHSMARASLNDALLAPRITALREMLPAALAGDVSAVHQSRVASRRLREVLPPLRDVLPHGAADRAKVEVRRVTRALGATRELDVAIALFESLVEAHGLDDAAAAAVRRSLATARAGAQRRLKAALPPRRRHKLESALEALAGHEPADAMERAQRAAGARVARRGRRLRKALDEAGAIYVPERLHQVRIAVKKLRYALEVTADLRGVRTPARVTQLRHIQDLLGRAHDLHVLGERLRTVQIGVVRTSRRTASALGRLARTIDTACRAEHAAFMSRRAGLLTLCASLAASPASPRRRATAVA
jgi:CHAD domain-containing protein